MWQLVLGAGASVPPPVPLAAAPCTDARLLLVQSRPIKSCLCRGTRIRTNEQQDRVGWAGQHEAVTGELMRGERLMESDSHELTAESRSTNPTEAGGAAASTLELLLGTRTLALTRLHPASIQHETSAKLSLSQLTGGDPPPPSLRYISC